MNRFKEKLLKTINICEVELQNRKNGILGESTEKQLEDMILPELYRLLDSVYNKQFPPVKERYLNCFANAFMVWGWDMQEPTELFILLNELNNNYKRL